MEETSLCLPYDTYADWSATLLGPVWHTSKANLPNKASFDKGFKGIFVMDFVSLKSSVTVWVSPYLHVAFLTCYDPVSGESSPTHY